jgi:uncharacterized protein YyaL (SSP411 family)
MLKIPFTILIFILSCQQTDYHNKPGSQSVHQYSNHLAKETSPYLLQHVNNPVDWYPWGKAALSRAKSEDKPILLSIGYSACHWCHVMAHESFEDPETARIMNELFVCIKVDREERPDIDQIYMKFVQMTTGSGGWPLNVFLTPDQEPFYGGTYFPPDDRYGRTSWRKVLNSVSHFYHNNKKQLEDNLEIVKKEFQKSQDEGHISNIPDKTIIKDGVQKLASLYDSKYGGIGQAPKFPAVYPLSLFLRYYKDSGDKDYLNMVTHSLRQMANGGIYDQAGGGFARYSVDAKWLVPHFEKMLYDNAQLIPLYLDTYLVSGDKYFLEVVKKTLTFVSRELLSPEGGFYSSLDADSEGIEGKFYVWEKSEIDQLLGKQNSEIFCDFYDVTANGNFEHKNILHIQTDVQTSAKRFNLNVDQVNNILNESLEILLKERNKRIRPGLDDKILSSWNGLMLSAYARTFQVVREESYKNVIEKNITFLKDKLFIENQLMRTHNKGEAKYAAYLEDYAFLIQGLLDAYEALFDTKYIEWAQDLLVYTNEKFWDKDHLGYFYTSSDQENLIERLKDEHDQSIPSGTSIMMINNLRFYSLTENSEFLSRAEDILKKYASRMRGNPYGYASYLLGVDFYLKKPKEIVLIIPDKTKAPEFYNTVFNTYLPNKVVIAIDEKPSSSALSASLLLGKTSLNGKITAYVCQNFACSQPVTDKADLKKLLE